MSDLNEFRMEVERAYDEYLYETEKRGISYGEIAYIQGLNRQNLNRLLKEIEFERYKNENHV